MQFQRVWYSSPVHPYLSSDLSFVLWFGMFLSFCAPCLAWQTATNHITSFLASFVLWLLKLCQYQILSLIEDIPVFQTCLVAYCSWYFLVIVTYFPIYYYCWIPLKCGTITLPVLDTNLSCLCLRTHIKSFTLCMILIAAFEHAGISS